MVLLSLAAVLLLEQAWPLPHPNRVSRTFRQLADAVERRFNAGRYHHGVFAWLAAVVPVAAAAFWVQQWTQQLNPVLAWAWNVLILYLTMGFRQFSHYFTDIMLALRSGRPDMGRDRLRQWSGEAVSEFDSSEISRVAIEVGLVDSHRHVFGVIAWFVVFGPAGAVLYRAATALRDHWGDRHDAEFGRFAADVFTWLDWVPSRLTAASFAIVGNFEDAVYCWRTQAGSWMVPADGVLLASGAGAMGVRLGGALHREGAARFRPEVGAGELADAGSMQSAVGLIWRSLLLWLAVILLATIAHALG